MSKNFTVQTDCITFLTIEVEAENEDDAIAKATSIPCIDWERETDFGTAEDYKAVESRIIKEYGWRKEVNE